MAPKFKMRTPSALSAIENNDSKSAHSQFSQLTDSDVRSVMKANNEVPEIEYLPRDMLEPLPFNDEVYGEIQTDSADLLATARDIAEVGIQEPLIVYKSTESGKYVILSGNRRFAASAIAKEQFPEQYREYRGGLPCIVQPAPENDQDLRKRMIKNNLQREKTPFVRMREIAVYSQMVTDEQAGQAGETNIREVICRDLGVSQSEVTRYLKIHASLIPSLMEQFEKQLLATNVAHKLAGETEENQAYVAEKWKFESPLTASELQNLLAQKALEKFGTEKKPQTRPARTPKYQLTDVHEGLTALSDHCSSLQALAASRSTINKRSANRILKKINAELEKLDELKAELEAIKEKAGD